MPLKSAAQHSNKRLEAVFNDCFADRYSTRLEGDADEPIYLPATATQPARILYRYDYFASALHEIAHWCLAGEERRKHEDYGYWYASDSRSSEQQKDFLRVEVKPQALEWVFSAAAGYPFAVSLDNINARPANPDWDYWQQLKQQKIEFTQACRKQAMLWLENGFPTRAQTFITQLLSEFRPGETLHSTDFDGAVWD